MYDKANNSIVIGIRMVHFIDIKYDYDSSDRSNRQKAHLYISAGNLEILQKV
jgi:hypothetical protein